MDTPGLYVHVPFCLSRCAYCGFTSGIYSPDRADSYLDALAAEISMRGGAMVGHPPGSVLIGGGTPSCLTVPQLRRLLDLVPPWSAETEATIELNPDSVSREKLVLLREHGINRCSFGVQTFDSAGLSLLERRHSALQAVRAVTLARDLGFPQINLDLIAGWPDQSLRSVAEDCRRAIDLGTTHISCYMLMPDENTEFPNKVAERGLQFQSDDQTRAVWDTVEEELAGEFRHYEVSNYARPSCECRHNLSTWKGGEYYGFGAAAHSHLGGTRSANTDSVEDYCARLLAGDSPEAFSETLPLLDKARETAVMWLRLTEGIDAAEYAARTGLTLAEVYPEEIPSLVRRGMLEWDPDKTVLKVPAEWYPMLDSILVELV